MSTAERKVIKEGENEAMSEKKKKNNNIWLISLNESLQPHFSAFKIKERSVSLAISKGLLQLLTAVIAGFLEKK